MFNLIFAAYLVSVTTTMTFDWGVIVSAVAPILAIVVTWYLQRKSTNKVQESVSAVHSIVNGKNDALMARVAELESENRKLKGN